MSQQVEVRLFGAFRQYSRDAAIAVTLPESATVTNLREAFADALEDDNARALLKASAFATDEAVLDEDDSVPEHGRISILPPVCGG